LNVRSQQQGGRELVLIIIIIIIIIIEEASRRIPHMVVSADAQNDDADDTMIWSPAQVARLARSRRTARALVAGHSPRRV
jgi:hypothetical protein